MIDKIRFKLFWRLRELSERISILWGNNHIIIYTMGKVGSTSLYYSLKSVFGSKVLFVHRMKKENIALYNKPFKENNIKPDRSALATYIKKKLIDKKKPLSVITMVREPIARNISSFFQSFRAYNNGLDFKSVPIDIATENFINNFPHDAPQYWFDHEFLPTIGINLEQIQFDITQKVSFLKNENYKVLLMRIDLEDDKKDEYLQKFTNNSDIKIGINNAHFQKEYSSYYREFLNKITLPQELINDIYSAKYLSFFYSKEEIKLFKNKWNKKNNI